MKAKVQGGNTAAMTIEQAQAVITNHKNMNEKFANNIIDWYFSKNTIDWEAFLESKRIEKIITSGGVLSN